MQKIGFVIDNTSVLQIEDIDTNNIASMFNLKTYTDDELEIEKDFNNDYDEYYKHLDENNQFGKTSTASIGDIKEAIEIGLEKYEQVIVLPTMSKVSSTYNNTVIASKEFGDKVHVVDTCSVVGSTKFLIDFANNEMKNNSDLTASELASMMRIKAQNSVTYILISSFDALVHNGRIGKAKSQIASLLNIKAIVSLSSEGVEIESKFRTYSKAIKYLKDLISEQYDDKYDVFSGTILNNDLFEQFKKSIDNIKVTKISIPPIIGLHGGIGLLGVTFMKK